MTLRYLRGALRRVGVVVEVAAAKEVPTCSLVEVRSAVEEAVVA